MQLGEHILQNGRKYYLTDQGTYIHGEYPSGGIKITAWDARLNQGKGIWIYIDTAPNLDCARNFLNAAKRLDRIN